MAMPGGAAAKRVTYGVAEYPREIQLLGSEVLLQVTTADGSVETRALAPGGGFRVLNRTPPPPRTWGLNASFAASATHLAIGSVLVQPCGCHAQYTYYMGSRVDSGPLGGPLTEEPDTCSDYSGSQGVGVDGSRVAFVSGCPPNRGGRRIIVRDLATRSTLAVVAEDDAAQPRLAGRYLAYAGRGRFRFGDVVVYDYEAGREVYRVPLGSGGGFDLQSDGKVVTTTRSREDLSPVDGSSDCVAVDWASPEQPTPHDLPGTRCPVGYAQIAGDRIAFAANYDNGEAAHVVSDLAGNVQRSSSPLATTWNWDGSRLALAAPRCAGGTEIVVDDFDGPPVSESPDCPVTVQRAPLRISRDWRVRYRVACRLGCRGQLGISTVRSRALLLRTPQLEIGPGETRTLSGKLTPSARRLFRRRGSMPVVMQGFVDRRDIQRGAFEVKQKLLAPR
jgi:hypothetical protein